MSDTHRFTGRVARVTNLGAPRVGFYTWGFFLPIPMPFGITYDALGRPVEQNQPGTYKRSIVYAPTGEKLALVVGQGTVQWGYIPLTGGGTAIYTNGALGWYRHPDWLGSARLTSTPSRTFFGSGAFAPFGESYAWAGATDQPFTGKNQDTVSGLYDFPAREYSIQGRWPSPDPAGLAAVDPTNPQSWNRYAYVLNNPLNFVDPFGLDQCPTAALYDGSCLIFGGGGLGPGGMTCYQDFVATDCGEVNRNIDLGVAAPCPNNVCSGFNNKGEYFQFFAGAGGASAYIKFSDLTQGIYEWNGKFYSDAQFEAQVINPAVDLQRWALAEAIAAQNGEDVNSVYQQLTYVKTVGRSSDFNPGNIDLSFLNPSQDNRGGNVHLHPDGLIHLDTFNPFSSFPFGALGHFFVNVVIDNINSSVPRSP